MGARQRALGGAVLLESANELSASRSATPHSSWVSPCESLVAGAHFESGRDVKNGPHGRSEGRFSLSDYWSLNVVGGTSSLLGLATSAKGKCQTSQSGKQHQTAGGEHDTTVRRSGRTTSTGFRRSRRNGGRRERRCSRRNRRWP